MGDGNLGPLQVTGKSQVAPAELGYHTSSSGWGTKGNNTTSLGPSSPEREGVAFGVSALVVYLQASSELR